MTKTIIIRIVYSFLIETPKRVVKAYKEFFAGYDEDPEEILSRTFEEVEGYDDAVIVRNIRVESHCEHHMVPIVGVAHIGYIPKKRVLKEIYSEYKSCGSSSIFVSSPAGFEPARAMPNGFQVHLLNHSDTLSCVRGDVDANIALHDD